MQINSPQAVESSSQPEVLEDNPFRVSEVPLGSAVLVGDAAVSNVVGHFCATRAKCTHKQRPLNEAKLDGSTVTCPSRCSQFDVCAGAVLRGPAVGISKEIPVSFLLTAPGGALWVGTNSGFVCMPNTVLQYFDRSLMTMDHPAWA